MTVSAPKSANPPGAPANRGASLIALIPDFRKVLLLSAQIKQATATVNIVRSFLWKERIIHPRELRRGVVAQYLSGLAAQGRSPKTLINHRCAISSFCRFLADRELLHENPCRNIQLRPPEENLPRYLDDREIALVLKTAARHGIAPEVRLALSTGLRLSELMRLQWADVDLAGRSLAVRKSKSHRPRVIPLSRSALAALAEQRDKTRRSGPAIQYVFPARHTWPGGWAYVDKPRCPATWQRILGPIQDAVPKFRALAGKRTGRGWHLFRHTFASRAVQARPAVSLFKLALWLGHSDIRTTRIYSHLQNGYDEDIELADPGA